MKYRIFSCAYLLFASLPLILRELFALYQMCLCKCFLPIWSLLSHSLDIVFCRANQVFDFNEVQLINLFFHGSCFRYCTLMLLTYPSFFTFSPMLYSKCFVFTLRSVIYQVKCKFISNAYFWSDYSHFYSNPLEILFFYFKMTWIFCSTHIFTICINTMCAVCVLSPFSHI